MTGATVGLSPAEDQDDLAMLADRITRAEVAAPTHLHPAAKSTTANTALGPFAAALLDGARDSLSRHRPLRSQGRKSMS
jgi:hypothetical protein